MKNIIFFLIFLFLISSIDLLYAQDFKMPIVNDQCEPEQCELGYFNLLGVCVRKDLINMKNKEIVNKSIRYLENNSKKVTIPVSSVRKTKIVSIDGDILTLVNGALIKIPLKCNNYVSLETTVLLFEHKGLWKICTEKKKIFRVNILKPPQSSNPPRIYTINSGRSHINVQINDMKYKAFCPGWEAYDKVTILKGSELGDDYSIILFNISRMNICELNHGN
jgi:hypothetical protein